MVKVFTFEINPGSSQLLRETVGKVKPGRSANVIFQVMSQLFLKN
jgi:hypothetical protein